MKDEHSEETFIIEEVVDVSFTEEEVFNLGIIFIDELDELDFAVEQFFSRKISTEKIQLIDLGLTLSMVGNVDDPSWAVYKHTLSSELVSDVYNRENFYSITVNKMGNEINVISKAHIRDDYFEDDIVHHLESLTSNQRHEERAIRH